jgi:hypothetical protein
MSVKPNAHTSESPDQQHRLLRSAAWVYRYALSPVLHTTQRALTGGSGACRFQPTCSEYAALAVHLHGPVHGAALAVRRILRCHPFTRGGFDPVPAPTNPRVLHSYHRDEWGADAKPAEPVPLNPGHLP